MKDPQDSGAGQRQVGIPDPGRDGRPTTADSDLGGFAPSGEPKHLTDKGRANVDDTTAAIGSGKSARGALAEFGAVSDPKRISSLITSGQSISIPEEGHDDNANLKV